MQVARQPYFMSNPEWYEEVNLLENDDPDFDRGFILKDGAPQEAVDSYNAYYEMLESDDPAVMMSAKLSEMAFRD